MINLELLTETNIDAVRAIHREDIPVSWVDDADTLFTFSRMMFTKRIQIPRMRGYMLLTFISIAG